MIAFSLSFSNGSLMGMTLKPWLRRSSHFALSLWNEALEPWCIQESSSTIRAVPGQCASNLVAADHGVDDRHWQTIRTDEVEKARLEV